MVNQDLTYQKLIDYLARTTTPIQRIEYKKPWSCRFCLPSYENYHCLFFILVNINKEYEKFSIRKFNKNEISVVDLLPKIIKKKDGKYDEACNACIFIPDSPKEYKIFLEDTIISAADIIKLFNMKREDLILWICKAFKLNDELDENEKLDFDKIKLHQNSWKINTDGQGDDINLKDYFYKENFWENRLCTE